MRTTSSVLLMPGAVALLINAMPASARYTEHWMTSSEIARTQSQSAPAHQSKQAKRTLPRQTAVTTADDDPIAAFAHGNGSRGKTTGR